MRTVRVARHAVQMNRRALPVAAARLGASAAPATTASTSSSPYYRRALCSVANVATAPSAAASHAHDERENNDDDSDGELAHHNHNHRHQHHHNLSSSALDEIKKGRCHGCGQAFQVDSPTKPGYVPPQVALGEAFFQGNTVPQQADGSSSASASANSFASISEATDALFDSVGLGFTNAEGDFVDGDDPFLQQQQLHEAGAPQRLSDLPTRAAPRQQQRMNRNIVCHRCFSLKHYGKVLPIHVDISEFRDHLSKEISREVQAGTKVCIVQIADLLDIQGSFFPDFGDFVREASGDKPDDVSVFVIANKVDLLPENASKERVLGWLREEVRTRVGQGVNLSGVFTVSSVTGQGFDNMLRQLRREIHRGSDDDTEQRATLTREQKVEARSAELRQKYAVYIVGCSNSGKSTFVNMALEYLHGERGFWASHRKRTIEKNEGEGAARTYSSQVERDSITVASLPGTTLDMIAMPFGVGKRRPEKDKRTLLIDTPGVLQGHALTEMLRPGELKMLLPGGQVSIAASSSNPLGLSNRTKSKPMKPVVYGMHPGRSLLLGGIVSIDYVEGPLGAYVTTFVSRALKHHLTQTSKVHDLMVMHRGKMLSPPVKKRSTDNVNERVPLVTHEIKFAGSTWREAAVDITLPGIGWFSVTGPGQFTFRVSLPRSCVPTVRHSPLLPYETPAKGRKPKVHKR